MPNGRNLKYEQRTLTQTKLINPRQSLSRTYAFNRAMLWLVPRVPWPQKCGFSRLNFVATLYRSWDITFSDLLPVYGHHFYFRLGYSHHFYVVEVPLGRPTVWWKPHEQIPTRYENNRGGFGSPPLSTIVTNLGCPVELNSEKFHVIYLKWAYNTPIRPFIPNKTLFIALRYLFTLASNVTHFY